MINDSLSKIQNHGSDQLKETHFLHYHRRFKDSDSDKIYSTKIETNTKLGLQENKTPTYNN